jgi:hypothetical protein
MLLVGGREVPAAAASTLSPAQVKDHHPAKRRNCRLFLSSEGRTPKLPGSRVLVDFAATWMRSRQYSDSPECRLRTGEVTPDFRVTSRRASLAQGGTDG